MSMDALLEADSKVFVSPVVDLEIFRDKALEADEQIKNYFNGPAMSRFRELHDPFASSSSAGDAETQDENPFEGNSRLAFKYFLNSKGISFNEADETINQMDEALQTMLENNPIDSLCSAFPPEDSKLKLHKALNTFKNSKDMRKTKNKYLQRCKYYRYRPGELRRGYTEPDKEAEKDFVLTVHICAPKDSSKKLKEETTLLVRGELPLLKLRDKIFCAYDYFANLQDYEDATNPEDYYMNKYPSAFLFVHDTFYIDKRNPNAQDISEPIRKYMASKPKDFGPTNVADIQEYKIKDLNLRLGQPYVFTHIGDCEHNIIFTDLRLMHATDYQEMDFYPVFLSDRRPSPTCCACKNEVATFIISESDRIPLNPAFMCTPCFNAFHYDGDTRIGNFRAFHFIEHGVFE